MNTKDLTDQILFTEATRDASKSVIQIGDKYNLNLSEEAMRLALVEMYQLGMQYALKVIKEVE